MKIRLTALGFGILMAGSSAWAYHARSAAFYLTVAPVQS